FFFFQAEDGIRDDLVTGVQTCALPISRTARSSQTAPIFSAAILASPILRALNLISPGRARSASPSPFTRKPSSASITARALTFRSEERRVGTECKQLEWMENDKSKAKI